MSLTDGNPSLKRLQNRYRLVVLKEDTFYEVEIKAKQNLDEQQLKLEMKMSRLGGKVAELKKVNKSFGDKVILKEFD